MDQKQWKKINNIVDTALELKEPERSTYIQKQCKDDKQLKRKVTELIASIEESDTEDFLEDLEEYPSSLIPDLTDSSDAAIEEPALIGKTINRYKITSLIGHGGMGSVYLAERDDGTYSKQVALKLIRKGMDTPSNIARFKRERNILANLDHHNIARLLDGGVTEDGLPYLVMEYVEGTPLYEYCDSHQLSIQERLTLFRSICDAVQHAHKNAVIHRDLKPSNILVTDKNQIKILDFGIAKLLEPEDPGETLYQTQTGARLLTPGYAAPEQVEAQNITTSTDTYTLGILLYELLAGTHPFNLEDKNLDEIEHAIRKQIPLAPSEKVGALPSEKREKAANLRDTELSSLKDLLQGDLDAIVMKTLRKEPEERYDTVEQLLEDLHRRENNVPIIAREDTFRYKISRFIKRHKTGISVTAGFLVLIISFATFYTWQITEEHNRAEQQEEKARKTLEYLTNVFRYADPVQPSNQEITAQQILDWGTEYINEEVQNQPDIKASLINSIGTIYQHLGEYDKAESLLLEALSINRSLYSGDHPDLATNMQKWGEYNMTVGNLDTARTYLSKSTNMFKRLGNRSKYAANLGELGWVQYRNGNYEQADSFLNQALKINRQLHGIESQEAAMDLQYLGWIKNGMGEYNTADSLFQESLSIRKATLGNEHRLVAQTIQSLGRIYYNKEEYQKAKEHVTETLDLQKRIYESSHPDIATSLNILGLIHMRQQQYAKAKDYFQSALEIRINFYGPNHPDVLKSRNDLASIYYFEEDYLKAAELFKKVTKSTKEVRGASHPEVATSLNNLAKSLHKANREKESLQYYNQALKIGKRNYDRDHPKLIQFRRNKAVLHEALKQYGEAAQLWLTNFRALEQEHGLNHQDTKNALNHLIKCHRKLDNSEKVEQYNSILANI